MIDRDNETDELFVRCDAVAIHDGCNAHPTGCLIFQYGGALTLRQFLRDIAARGWQWQIASADVKKQHRHYCPACVAAKRFAEELQDVGGEG